MKFISSLFLLCFLSIVGLGQLGATINGVVYDSGFRAKKIKVYLKTENGKEITTETDSKGRFVFKNVANGKYVISGQILCDYKEKEIVISNNEVFEVQIDFMGSSCISQTQTDFPQIREQVNVSAGTSQPISEVSKTVNIVGEQEITDRNEISLTDTLRTIPGFRVQQLGGFGKTASIKTRGLRNQDTAILIDGIRFRDPSSITGDASAFLSDFSTANIGRVEVLRGSGSSVYGTNAIGGVIDFQTPTPRKEFNGSFASEYGGLGLTRFRGDVGAGTSDGKVAFTTGFSKTRFMRGIDGEDDADNLNYQGRVDYQPFANTSISGRIYFSDAFVRLNSSPDTLGDIPSGQIIDAREGVNFVADQNDPDSFQRSDFFSGQIALTQIINSKAIFSANYQGLKTKRENEDGILGVGFQSFFNSIYDGQIQTLNTKFDYIPVSNNRLTVGYEYEFEKFGNDGFNDDGTDQFSTSAKQKSNTFFMQNLLGLMNDKLQLAGGFRYQNFSLDTPQFSSTDPLRPRLIDPASPPNSYTFDGAASYYFAKTDTKLRVHIGNGYRVPSLYERFGSFFFLGSFTVIGNPQLEPERSMGFDGGIEQGFYENRLRLSATYFYTKINDEIAYLPTDDFGGAAYYNADKVFSRGFETSAEIRPFDKTNLFVSYTFVNSDERNSRRLTNLPPATLISTDVKRFGVPDHQFTLVATQQVGENLTVNFDFLATSDYLAPIFSNTSFSTVTYRFSGNRRGDLSARYSFLTLKEKYKFVVFGTVESIFDNEYFENGFRTAGINGRIGVGMNF